MARLQEQFDYLERLRRTGIRSIETTAPMLADEFQLALTAAQDVVRMWQKNYRTDDYAHLD